MRGFLCGVAMLGAVTAAVAQEAMPPVGVYVSSGFGGTLRLRKDGPIYVAVISDSKMMDGQYAGPFQAGQILIRNPYGNISYLPGARQLMFAGETWQFRQ